MADRPDDAVLERPRLFHLDRFPEVLLDCPTTDLFRYLPGPTLFRLPGRQERPLFVSVLLHGNEDAGWRAVQQVLRQHRSRELGRTLLLFVGNIEAAREDVRTLASQSDYNRTWPGTLHDTAPEALVMREVVESVAALAPFASVDIHNNTGHNPHYSCVNRLDEPFLQLARLFSRTVVYFEKPLGVQAAALARHCPAVTVECGRTGSEAGAEHAAELVLSALSMSHFPEHPVPDHDLDLLETFAIVKVPADATFSFDGSDADFRLRGDLDQLNFAELEPGTAFGTLGGSGARRLWVVAGRDQDEAAACFDYTDRNIRVSERVIPSMLTTDPSAVRLDCLGYLMHRIGRDRRRL